jgi:hypothetical protein
MYDGKTAKRDERLKLIRAKELTNLKLTNK